MGIVIGKTKLGSSGLNTNGNGLKCPRNGADSAAGLVDVDRCAERLQRLHATCHLSGQRVIRDAVAGAQRRPAVTNRSHGDAEPRRDVEQRVLVREVCVRKPEQARGGVADERGLGPGH